MKISKEIKDVCEHIRTEIMAGMVLIPKNEGDTIWNGANLRAVSIINKYKEGKGLFQDIEESKK